MRWLMHGSSSRPRWKCSIGQWSALHCGYLYLERCLSAKCLCLSLFSTGNYDRLARWARLTGKRFGHDDVEALPFMVSNIAHNPEFSKELSSIVLALFSGVRR